MPRLGFTLLPALAAVLSSFTAGVVADDTYNLQIQASTTQISDAFNANLQGSSSDQQYSVNIQGNVGTITQGSRTTNVVVSRQIPWSPLTLYAIIGENSDGITMGWVYCQDGQLTTLWLEDTTGSTGFTPSTVTGTCDVTSSEQDVTFTATAEDVTIQLPPSYPTIDGGSDLSLAPGSVGSVVLQSQPYDLAPFALVDCTQCQSSTVDGGWWEVHSVMSATSSSNVCLGIFYLPVKHTATIALDYVNCFAENIGDQSFTATYSIPDNLDGSARVSSAGTKEAEFSQRPPFEALRDNAL